jgi:hypothetical protein
MGSQGHAPGCFNSGKETLCTGGLVSPRAGLDHAENLAPPLGFDPRTVQPVPSRYTGYAIQAHPYQISQNSVNEFPTEL